MKDTIKNTVSEVYGRSISTLTDNTDIVGTIPRKINTAPNKNMTSRFVNNNSNTITKSMNTASKVSSLSASTPSYDYNQRHRGSGLWILVVLFLIVVVCGLIWFFKDDITKMINDMKNDKSKEKDEEGEDEQEYDAVKEMGDEEDRTQPEDKEQSKKIGGTTDVKERPDMSKDKREEDKMKRGVNEKELLQNYSPSQIIGENGGYCFIGSDDNMRHCVKAYKGDICSSGDIYSRIDKCLVPSLRISP